MDCVNSFITTAAWFNWSRCWRRGRRGRFEDNFYIRDVCTNRRLKCGLVS